MTASNERPSIGLVHEDARGEMYSILLPGGREVMLLHSKAGALRGGHSHSVPEQVLVLKGSFRYHKLRGNEERVEVLREGMTSYNPAGLVHMGEFPEEDTWLIEAKLANVGEWTQENYPPWRARVDANAHP